MSLVELRSPTHQLHSDRFAHSAATAAMTPIAINSRVFIPANTAAANELNEFFYQSEVTGPALGGEAWAVGDKIYWDAANSRFTKTAGALPVCGYATQPKPSADTVSPRFFFNSFAA